MADEIVCSSCRLPIRPGDVQRHGYGGVTHEGRHCVALLRMELDRVCAWQRSANDLLKVFEFAVSKMVDNPPVTPDSVAAVEFGFRGWIDGARKVCADTREFLRAGVVAAVEEGPSFDFKRLLLSGCKCVEIMQADETRHFRGCPLREKYPNDPEKGEFAPIKFADGSSRTWESLLEDANDLCAKRFDEIERLKQINELYKMALMKIVEGGPEMSTRQERALRAIAREALSPSTFAADDPRMNNIVGDRRCQHVERVGDQQDPRQCVRSEGHPGPHWPSPERELLPSNAWSSREAAPPGAVEHKWEEGKSVFDHELEEHRKQMEDDSERYTGQHASIEVRRLREAVQFLLAVVHQPGEPKLEEYGRALGADLQALVGRVEQLSNSLGIFDKTFNARLNGEAERVKQLEDQKLKLRIDGVDARLRDMEAKTGLVYSASFFDRIEKLEERVEELDDTLSHDFGVLRDRGDVHDDRLKKLEVVRVADVRLDAFNARVDAVEKAVILHEKRLDAQFKFANEVTPAMQRLESNISRGVGPLSELLSILISARGPGSLEDGEMKTVLRSLHERLLRQPVKRETAMRDGFDAMYGAASQAAVDESQRQVPVIAVGQTWISKSTGARWVVDHESEANPDMWHCRALFDGVERAFWGDELRGSYICPESPDAALARKIHELVRRAVPYQPDRPRIVCLCGSTRFMPAFHKAQLDETLKGNIVLTVGNTHESDRELCLQPDTKKMLDELHKKKIDMADEVFVLNCLRCTQCDRDEERTKSIHCPCNPDPRSSVHNLQPYIGESTRGEIAHALSLGKPVRFLNDQLIDETFWKSVRLAEPSGYPRKMVPGDTLTYRGGR